MQTASKRYRDPLLVLLKCKLWKRWSNKRQKREQTTFVLVISDQRSVEWVGGTTGYSAVTSGANVECWLAHCTMSLMVIHNQFLAIMQTLLLSSTKALFIMLFALFERSWYEQRRIKIYLKKVAVPCSLPASYILSSVSPWGVRKVAGPWQIPVIRHVWTRVSIILYFTINISSLLTDTGVWVEGSSALHVSILVTELKHVSTLPRDCCWSIQFSLDTWHIRTLNKGHISKYL